MQVLLLLAKRPGEVWSRQALLEEIWKDSVVGEEILTRAISELRRIFGDKARDPRFIETIRNHGYRLIETPQMVVREEPKIPVLEKPARKFPLIQVVAVVLVILLLGSGVKYLTADRNSAGGSPQFTSVIPLTSFPGREWHPALSADGSLVAFVWEGPEDLSTNIYVKQRNSETLLRLTDNPGWVAWPTWSPDGQNIAFVQAGQGGATVSMVPSLGGPVRRLHQVMSWIEGLDYAPDGKSLLFASRHPESGKFGIYQLGLQDLEVRQLELGPDQRAGDFQPRFSPDGSSLAWVGVGLNGNSSIYLADFPDGKTRRVSAEHANLQGLAFSADGESIIFSASPAGTFNLWQISLKSGSQKTAQRVATPGEFAWNPSVARGSGDLVFEQVRVDQDIWGIHILDRDPWQMETAPFLQSTRWEYESDFNAEGTEVAFISARSGSPELWLAGIDGGNLRKLTSLNSSGLTNPRWSPDGNQLAFNILKDSRSVIMLISARGGEPRVLTPEGETEVFCSWAHDGGSLLFGGNRENGWEIHRRHLNGNQTALVIANGATTAVESEDGSLLFFTRPDQNGLWSLSLGENGEYIPGEQPKLILEALASQDQHNWVYNQERIFWIFRTGGLPMLAVTNLYTGHYSLLTELTGMTGNGLAVSPDGTRILYPKTGPMEGDLMVFENSKE